MKTILIASDNFLPRKDGVTTFLTEVIPRLNEIYNIIVIAPKFSGKFENKENQYGRVVRIDTTKYKIGDIDVAKPSAGVIKALVKKADFIWSQTIGPVGFLAIYYGHYYKKKVISYIHSVEFELFSKALPNMFLQKAVEMTTTKAINFIYKKSDYLLVPSLELAEILTWKGVKTKKILVPLGVDINKFKPTTLSVKDKIRKELGIDLRAKVILYIGRLSREKDLKTLFRAFLRIEKKFRNVKLLIVGKGIKDITNMFREKENVIVAGQKNNVVPYYQVSDIYVISSLTETTSLTTLEAMSCEMPVICTPVGLIKNYITDGQNGILFPKGDYLTLTKKLEILLKDAPLRSRLGFHARLTVKEKFAWQKTIKKIKAVFKKLEKGTI